MQRLLLFWAMGCLVVSSAAGQPSIQRYLRDLKGYQFVELQRISKLQPGKQLGPLSAEVIAEFVLVSYSRWSVLSGEAGERLQMEIFEMLDPQGAFGIFSLWDGPERGERLNLAVDNYYKDQGLIFWRGHYFFHLSGGSAEPMRRLAAGFVEAINLIHVHPVSVVHLPERNLDPKSIRYYLGKSSFRLNQDFPQFLVEKIGFEHDIEVAAARYAPEGHSLFLIGYPTAALAAEYFLKLQNALKSYFSAEGIYMKRAGVIISVFVGPETEAKQILDNVKYARSIKWIYEKEADEEELKAKRGKAASFLGAVARTLIATGAFILLTLVGGLVVGLARYEVLKRHPHLGKKDAMIRLELDKSLGSQKPQPGSQW